MSAVPGIDTGGGGFQGSSGASSTGATIGEVSLGGIQFGGSPSVGQNVAWIAAGVGVAIAAMLWATRRKKG